MNLLLTGASGFVGQALQAHLLQQRQHQLRSAMRVVPAEIPAGLLICPSPELGAAADWSAALENIEVVIHAAAKVQAMGAQTPETQQVFHDVNVEGTLSLARQAAAAGVKRFIFISSIKVNGEQTVPGRPYSFQDTPSPEDAYGLSKLDAETRLLALAKETGMEVVIIRPPMIYGPGVKGNFASLLKLVNKGLPLPLGAIHNLRSFVSVTNLVSLIATCIQHPAAGNRVFLVSDGDDLSTTQLLSLIGHAAGKPARLIPVPEKVLRTICALVGKQGIARRLLDSLQVDITATCQILDWQPPMTVAESLRLCVAKKEAL